MLTTPPPNFGGPTSVNTHVSDLFFNTDVSDAMLYEHGPRGRTFTGFDDAKLRDEALWFLEALDKLNVGDLPDVDSLIADFFGRL